METLNVPSTTTSPAEKATSEVQMTDATNKNTNSTVGSTASTALAYLLREDPLLSQLNLTTLSNTNKKDNAASSSSQEDGEQSQQPADAEAAAFSYAAALINAESSWLAPSTSNDPAAPDSQNNNNIQQKANEALVEVEQKLALVESLAERISREKPEHVAGPLLKLHGYSPTQLASSSSSSASAANKQQELVDDNTEMNTNSTLTLIATRERSERLYRQSHVLDSVAQRVESTLVRGQTRMQAATSKLERVLLTSQVLKMTMRLKFEAKKILGSSLSGQNFDTLQNNEQEQNGDDSAGLSYAVDLRDLTRAAASVAVIEELLNHEDLKNQQIDIVEQMRPEAERVAKSVRNAAAGLLRGGFGVGGGGGNTSNDDEEEKSSNSGSRMSILSATKLGATLQVYYHLGELPDAVWKAVGLGLERTEKASGQFLNPSAILRLLENAKGEAKLISEQDQVVAGATSTSEKKKRIEIAYNRALKKKLREKRAEAASKWAFGVSETALQIWNLHRVLSRKSDPVSRESFLDVVNSAPVPKKFAKAQELLHSSLQSTESMGTTKKNSIFALFWNQMCISLGGRIQKLLKYDSGKMANDVSSFYPAARAASLEMLTLIQDTMQAGTIVTSSTFMDESMIGGMAVGGSSSTSGILGGSSGLDDAVFFGLVNEDGNSADIAGGAFNGMLSSNYANDIDHGVFGAVSADTWTKSDSRTKNSGNDSYAKTPFGSSRGATTSQTSTGLSSILSSPEWLALQGFGDTGLYPMQRSFLNDLNERLQGPLKSLFVENSVVDEHGISVSVLPSLPTQNDVKTIEKNIRNELSLADPREGGGDSSMATMISETVVDIVERFCQMAKNATSNTVEDKLFKDKGVPTEELLHDMKVAEVMSLLATALRNLPENTFVVPYRPAHSVQHEEAANMCQIALLPALHEVETFVKGEVLNPLCRVLNTRIASAIAKMHSGTYLESSSTVHDGGSFVRDHLVDMYESITTNVMSHLPVEYASIVATTLVTFSIYCFISNATLVRPLGEVGRLRITQDLADFELTLDQMLNKVGCSTALSQINDGKPYAELRAVRQMLFWNGLEDNQHLSAELVAKAFLREVWIRDIRASTAFHFLFSFAPKLLSSPHHSSRMSAEDYVKNLIQLDGALDDGESKSWITTMACCDAYQQRESMDGSAVGGDKRVAAILMIIGPEILRRKRH